MAKRERFDMVENSAKLFDIMTCPNPEIEILVVQI
jgi:hypothetical protein